MPFKTKEQKKEYNKQYRLDNKEKLKELAKQYQMDNKEKIKARENSNDKRALSRRRHYDKNKVFYVEYQKQYYQDNRDKEKENEKKRLYRYTLKMDWLNRIDLSFFN